LHPDGIVPTLKKPFESGLPAWGEAKKADPPKPLDVVPERNP
jgi:hypothetical protein